MSLEVAVILILWAFVLGLYIGSRDREPPE